MLRTLIQKKDKLRSEMTALWQVKEGGKSWSKEQSENYDSLNEKVKKLDQDIKLRSEFVENFNQSLPKPEKEFRQNEKHCSVFNLIKRELHREKPSDFKIDPGPIDEVIQERANNFPECRSLGGSPVPLRDFGLKTRDTLDTSSGSGADLVQDTIYPDIVPNLYEKSWTGRVGAEIIENWRGDFLLPSEDTKPASGFVAETTAYAESSIDYKSAITLKPLKVGALQPFSLQSFMQDETRKLQNSINSQLMKEWAKKVDGSFLDGNGTAPNPRGLFNIADIQEVDASNTANVSEALTFAKLLECEGELLNENQDMSPVWLINSKTLIHARGTLRNNVAGSLYLANKNSIADRRFVLTNLVPSDKKKGTESTSTSSWAVLLIPSSVVVVNWAMPTISIDRSLGFKTDTIWTKVSGYVNVGLKRATDVVVLKNIKTS